MNQEMKIPQLVTLRHRELFGYWLNEQGLTGEGAEIGCAFGANAANILSQWKGERLYMVDPWASQSPEVYREQHDKVPYDGWYQDCQKLAEKDQRITLIRKLSVDGAKEIPDYSLDFAYIDGNHGYGPVLEDMDSWWSKVKIGGVMGGHDYYTDTNPPNFCEVEAAVKRWAQQNNVPFQITLPCSSWWIAKLHGIHR
jgi:hypothetical protein